MAANGTGVRSPLLASWPSIDGYRPGHDVLKRSGDVGFEKPQGQSNNGEYANDPQALPTDFRWPSTHGNGVGRFVVFRLLGGHRHSLSFKETKDRRFCRAVLGTRQTENLRPSADISVEPRAPLAPQGVCPLYPRSTLKHLASQMTASTSICPSRPHAPHRLQRSSPDRLRMGVAPEIGHGLLARPDHAVDRIDLLREVGGVRGRGLIVSGKEATVLDARLPHLCDRGATHGHEGRRSVRGSYDA